MKHQSNNIKLTEHHQLLWHHVSTLTLEQLTKANKVAKVNIAMVSIKATLRLTFLNLHYIAQCQQNSTINDNTLSVITTYQAKIIKSSGVYIHCVTSHRR